MALVNSLFPTHARQRDPGDSRWALPPGTDVSSCEPARQGRLNAFSGDGYLMGHNHFRGLAQRLVDDAIALSKANKRTQLIFRCVGLQVEVKEDGLKSKRL